MVSDSSKVGVANIVASRYRAMLSMLALVSGLIYAHAAQSQIKLESGPFSLVTEGWVNATGGGAIPQGDRRDGARGHVFADAALRGLGLYQIAPDISIGPRVVLSTNTDDEFSFEQATALVQGPWGRFEVGRRQGLPDVLLGYAPNPYTYTSAEYGPASGVSLDPDGGLPTRFLRRDLREQFDSLTYLGNTTALFGDRAIKGLYVSPRLNGFIFGLAYTPDAGTAPEGRGRNFDNLLQSGVSYEIYSGQEIYRFGASYTYGDGHGRVEDLHSFSGGASVSLDDRFQDGSTTILGVNVSSNADTGLVRQKGGGFSSTAIGVTTSANYEIGPWIFGGYYQFATAEGDVVRTGNDRLHIVEVGASYRFTTQLRLFTSTYLYRFYDEGGGRAAERSDGAVFLLGVRATL